MRRFLVALVWRRMVLVALGDCRGAGAEGTTPTGEPGAGWALWATPGVMVAEVVLTEPWGVGGDSGDTGVVGGDVGSGRAFSLWAALFSRT